MGVCTLKWCLFVVLCSCCLATVEKKRKGDKTSVLWCLFVVLWLAVALNKFEFLEEVDEEELDRKEIREKERRSLDMIIKSSNIFALIWFHRNISVSKYVTKFFGSKLFFKTIFQKKKRVFLKII